MRKFTLVVLPILLAGCASSIMNSFVGQPVQQTVLKYGPPANAMDMPDGSRAFQWVRSSSYTTPVTANSYGHVAGYGNNAIWMQNTQISGGQTFTSSCAYTLFARWNEASNAWIVTGYQKPNLMCE